MKKRGQRLNHWRLIRNITKGLYQHHFQKFYGDDTKRFFEGPLNRLILVMVIRCVERQNRTSVEGNK
jgi:hypothetical protein